MPSKTEKSNAKSIKDKTTVDGPRCVQGRTKRAVCLGGHIGIRLYNLFIKRLLIQFKL